MKYYTILYCIVLYCTICRWYPMTYHDMPRHKTCPETAVSAKQGTLKSSLLALRKDVWQFLCCNQSDPAWQTRTVFYVAAIWSLNPSYTWPHCLQGSGDFSKLMQTLWMVVGKHLAKSSPISKGRRCFEMFRVLISSGGAWGSFGVDCASDFRRSLLGDKLTIQGVRGSYGERKHLLVEAFQLDFMSSLLSGFRFMWMFIN